MKTNFKLTENKKYQAGENHCKWYLNVNLYQYYDNYYYEIFDNEDDQIIISETVSAKTINELEKTIFDTLNKTGSYDNINDLFNEIQKSFYGIFFAIEELTQWKN